MINLKNSINALINKIGIDRKTAVVAFLGIAGVVILVLSELLPSDSADEKAQKLAEPSVMSCAEYEKELEQRLETIISKIDGAGNVSVMVTLESTAEEIYAQQEKDDRENSKHENDYVIIKTNDGEGGILLKTAQPQVRGVAVVCTGGGSAVVCRSITDTVTAVLGISSARVNISSMKSNNGG